jgi:DNA repair protein RecO (recombination protein O)
VSRVVLEPAFVLHHRPYRDTSLLLELLTCTHGRVGVVARGARGPRSRTRGLLQPFRPLLVSWSGRGELVTLTGVEAGTPSPPLPPGRLMSGFYLNELLIRLLGRHDPQQELFGRYAGTLAAMGSCDGRTLEVLLRRFEKQLLELLGYGLNLTHDAYTGQPVRADCQYRFRADAGPEIVGVCDGGRTVSGASLLALEAGEFTEALHLREARVVLREALDRQLGGRALHTRQVARATRAMSAAAGGGEAPGPVREAPARESNP